MAGSILLPIKALFDDKGLKDAQKGFATMGKGLKATLATVGVGLGLNAVVDGFTAAAKAAAEDNKSQELLAAQIRNSTSATIDQIAASKMFVDSLSLQTGIVDDELRPALTNLVRATGDLGKAQTLLALSTDIAAGTGRDLGTVTNAVSKAANGNRTALDKLVPSLKKSSDWAGAAALQFKGMGEAAGNANPFAKLTVIFQQLQEQVGYALLPYLQQLTEYLTSTEGQQQLQELVSVFVNLAVAIANVVSWLIQNHSWIGALVTAIGVAVAAWGVYSAALAVMTFATGTATAAVNALKAALISTGVGAVLVILGSVVSGIMSIGSAADTATGQVAGLAQATAGVGINQGDIYGNKPWVTSAGLGTLTNVQTKPGTTTDYFDAKTNTWWTYTYMGGGKWSKKKITFGGDISTAPKTPAGETAAEKAAKAAAELAKKNKEAYAKIIASENEIRDAMLQSAIDSRAAILSMREDFASVLEDVKPLPKAAAVVGEFEQQVVDSFQAIEDQIASSLADGTLLQDAADNLRKYAAAEKATLAGIARQRDVIAKKLDIAKTISADVLSFGNINDLLDQQTNTVTETFTRMVDGIQVATTRSFEQVTSGGLVDNFKKVIEKTKAYAKNLIELKRLGLNGQLFKQIVDAGVDAGGATAQAIVAGGASQVTELNALFGELNDLGGKVAAESTDVMYAAGEDVMNSFIQSLLDQDAALQATAITLAESFANAFRNKLVSLAPLMKLPLETSQIALSDALTGYVADQYGRTFTGPYNYYGQEMVGGLGANYNITINAGAITEKASLPGLIVDALATYTRQSGSGALNRVLNIA
jgi:hypothetical protein